MNPVTDSGNATEERLSELGISGYAHLQIDSPCSGVVRIVLSRPDVRNALNESMIADLAGSMQRISTRLAPSEFRVLVVQGQGAVFCAGADLEMMQRQGQAGYEGNLEDSRKLAQLFRSLSAVPVPVVAVVQGAAIGGGFGLAVCADIVVTHEAAVFATTEVRLGLVPAVISPYILRKLGPGGASYPLLCGQRLTGAEALRLNLAHILVPLSEDIPAAVDRLVGDLLHTGPEAARETKALISQACPLPQEKQVQATVQSIARVRQSQEAQSGLRAFFERTAPEWVPVYPEGGGGKS
jgi:methylglutaconyl-CoA hydratase